MSYVKVLAIKKQNILALTLFAALMGIAVFAPLIGKQAIVGPIVNATLFISAVLLGAPAAILVGLFPSLIALITGLLPVALAPMVPFIMTGNALLILVFDYFRKNNYWLGVFTASFLKFIFLFLTSSAVIDLVLKKDIASQIAAMMGSPQLFNALAGGFLAFVFLRILKEFTARFENKFKKL